MHRLFTFSGCGPLQPTPIRQPQILRLFRLAAVQTASEVALSLDPQRAPAAPLLPAGAALVSTSRVDASAVTIATGVPKLPPVKKLPLKMPACMGYLRKER